MAKKILAVILAVVMLAAVLAACGTTPAPSNDGDKPAPAPTPAPSGDKDKEEEKKDEEPAKEEYTQTYALKYSSYAPEGHPTNVIFEVPLKEFIEKESNGRITVEIYSAGSLTTQASTLDGIINGGA